MKLELTIINRKCEWIDEVIVNGKRCFKTKDKLFADPLRNVSLILGDLQTTSKTYGMIKNLYVTNFGNSGKMNDRRK